MIRVKRWNKSKSEQLFSVFNIFFMCFIIIIMLYPMIYILFASVSDPYQLIAHSGLIVKPLGWNLSSYQKVFSNRMIGIGYSNTLFIAASYTHLRAHETDSYLV